MSASEPEFFYDIEQSSPEWFEIRRGIPTASNFATILANLKGAETLLNDLVGECISGQVTETYQNASMARGKEMEAEVRERFGQRSLAELRTVGFVRREIRPGRFIGCSPDALFASKNVGLDAVLEIKTQKPGLMIATRKNGYDPTVCPSEHMAQVQGALWVTGFQYAELVTWYRGMPFDLHYRVKRDEAYIKTLAAAVEAFDARIEKLVKESKKWA